MRGEVLGFDQSSGTGVLRAEDGRRYAFAVSQWREADEPVKGDRIDFEPSGKQATEIYLVTATGLGERIRSFPAFLRAFFRWFRRHPEAVVALSLMAATALPVYGFLGVEEPLLAAPRVVERLELGLGRIRMLVADIPEAGTAAAAMRAILPMIYLLWAVPIMALLLLYRSLAELPRRALAFWTGITSVLLPVLLPLAIAVPTTILVLSQMPPDMRATVAGSVFDATSLGPFRDIALGGLVIMMLGFALVLWGMRPETARRPAPARSRAPRAAGNRSAKRAAPPPKAPQPAPRAAVPAPPVPQPPSQPRTPPPPVPPTQRPPAVAGPAHPPAPPQPRRVTPAPVKAFAPPARDSAPPAPPPPHDFDDPLPQVLTRGRQPVAGMDLPDSIDARAGEGLPAEATATGWEVEATGSMNAEPPPVTAPPHRGTQGEDDLLSGDPLPQPRPNGALPPPEPAREPEPPPPPPPPQRFELDQGPDAVMKLYEKLRAERLARDAGKKDGK